MKKLIIAALLATALTGCVDNTSNGGPDGAPYNNSGMNGNSDNSSNRTDNKDGTWSAGDDGFADSDSDLF